MNELIHKNTQHPFVFNVTEDLPCDSRGAMEIIYIDLDSNATAIRFIELDTEGFVRLNSRLDEIRFYSCFFFFSLLLSLC